MKYTTPNHIVKARKELEKVSDTIRELKKDIRLYDKYKMSVTVSETKNKLNNAVKMAKYIHIILKQHNQMKKLHYKFKSVQDHVNSIYAME